MKLNRLYLSLLLLFSFALQADPYAYLANENLDEVDVINTAINSIVTRIPIPLGQGGFPTIPRSIAIAPNGTTVCTLNSVINTTGSRMITASVIDATLTIPVLISTIQVTNSFVANSKPTAIAYTTDSNSVYITETTGLGGTGGNVYSIIDITGSQTVSTVTTAIIAPNAIAIGNTPNGQTAYIGTDNNGIYYMSIPGNTPNQIPSTGGTYIATESIAISPNGDTVYAVSYSSNLNVAFLYVIDTRTNTVTQTINFPNVVPTGIIASPDGNYIYITDNNNGDIILMPTDDISPSYSTFLSADAIALAITPDSKELFVTDENAMVSPYSVPAGISAGSPLTLGGAAGISSIVIAPLSLLPPASISGCKTQNVFLLQTDYINNITWTAPASGTPALYAIYRDPALTQLVTMIPATSPLQYYDHDRNPTVTYTYYIVSVDASGNQSAPASVTVTQNC